MEHVTDRTLTTSIIGGVVHIMLPDATAESGFRSYQILVSDLLLERQLLALKDAINGYAGLDAQGKINTNQLPAIAITNTYIVSSQSEMLALSVTVGTVAIRTDQSKSYILKTEPSSVLGNWIELQGVSGVASFNARTGTVTPQNNDYNADQITETASRVHLTPEEKARLALLTGVDSTAFHSNANSEISGLTDIGTIADGTLFLVEKTGVFSKVKAAFSLIKSTLKTYFDTLYTGITHNHDTVYAPIRTDDQNYVTDTNLVNINNLSGINTGNQSSDQITIFGTGSGADPFYVSPKLIGLEDVIELITFAASNPSGTAGQKYYNTSSKKILTYTTSWGGAADPIGSILYIVLDVDPLYRWTGSTMISVGGTDSAPVISKNNDFDPSDIILDIDFQYCTQYTQTTVIEIDTYASTAGTNCYLYVPIVTNGNDWTFPVDWCAIRNEYLNDVADYALIIYYDGFNWQYLFYKVKDIDLTAPVITTAIVAESTPAVLNFSFSKAVTITTSGWSIETDGAALSITGVSGSGTSSPSFTLSRDIVAGETITISYNSGTGNTKDLLDNYLVSVTDRSVTNNVSAYGSLLLSFNTVKSGSFAPSLNPNAGVLHWDFGDETTFDGNTVTGKSYADGTKKTVKVYQNTVSSVSSITFGQLSECNITDSIDFSNFTGMTMINVAGTVTSNITGIVLPHTDMISVVIESSNIVDVDLSNATELSGTVNIKGANIESIIWPSSIDAFASFTIGAGKITSLDLSSYDISSTFVLVGCTLLDTLVLPGSGTINSFSLALANLVNVSGSFNWHKSTTTQTSFYGCGMNQSSVDYVLSALDNWFSATAPTRNYTLYLSAGTNASPTNGASNTNYVHIQTLFTNAGYTLTKAIN